MEKKVISFYRKSVYGQTLEYIADADDRKLIESITGQKTINGRVRELFRDLSGCRIDFREVLAP